MIYRHFPPYPTHSSSVSVLSNILVTYKNLSQHINKLETHYRTPLFYRKPKLQLTPAGKALYDSCIKILTEEDNISRQMNDIIQNNVGSLSIGASQYRGQYWLPLILPDYLKCWPNINVQVTMERSEKMEQLLVSGDLDFFVGIKHGDDSLLRFIPLMNDKVYMAITRELMEQYFGKETDTIITKCSNGTTLKEFKEVPFMRLKSTYRLRMLTDKCFQAVGYKPRQILEVESIDLMISLFPYSLGAFFCTGMRVPSLKTAHPNTYFFPVQLNGKTLLNPLGIVYHKDRFLPRYAQDFMERLKSFFASFENSSC